MNHEEKLYYKEIIPPKDRPKKGKILSSRHWKGSPRTVEQWPGGWGSRKGNLQTGDESDTPRETG